MRLTMADDLISRQAAKEAVKYIPWCDWKAVGDCLDKLPASDAVEVGNCEGCIYSNRKRPQKCSCCRRNRDLKDCYERREENAD